MSIQPQDDSAHTLLALSYHAVSCREMPTTFAVEVPKRTTVAEVVAAAAGRAGGLSEEEELLAVDNRASGGAPLRLLPANTQARVSARWPRLLARLLAGIGWCVLHLLQPLPALPLTCQPTTLLTLHGRRSQIGPQSTSASGCGGCPDSAPIQSAVWCTISSTSEGV